MNIIKKILLKIEFINWFYEKGYFSVPLKVLFVNFIFQRIFRINSECKYSINFKSTIVNGEKISVGRYSAKSLSITPGLYIQCGNGIVLGDDVLIGPNVSIVSANHSVEKRHEWDTASPVKIGNNVWIGSNSIILPEVSLGDNSIVGAGSVVTKSFPSNVVIVGNPANVVKNLPPINRV